MSHTAVQSKAGMDDLFRNRFIQVVLLSVFFLQIGIWVRNYSVLLYVIEKTNGNPVAVSLIFIAEYAPIFLFCFIGGTFAERLRPKRTMVWCDFLSAVSVFIGLLTLMLGSWKAVFLATLVSAILSQFSQPSGMKLFKVHVPAELVLAGMSMYQTMYAVFMILGPIIGTFVYQSFGIKAAIIVMGITFLLSSVILLLLPEDRAVRKNNEKTTFVSDFQKNSFNG
ncbi:MFS transporter [Fictibacillus sp. NRS-1165]|uniref:MFS transporter n=1 Tax=Fictibacillus sp. NRS-1165 TaxID=3144463 RepID=UPI003D2495A8